LGRACAEELSGTVRAPGWLRKGGLKGSGLLQAQGWEAQAVSGVGFSWGGGRYPSKLQQRVVPTYGTKAKSTALLHLLSPSHSNICSY
jgi:hypothetical protein